MYITNVNNDIKCKLDCENCHFVPFSCQRDRSLILYTALAICKKTLRGRAVTVMQINCVILTGSTNGNYALHYWE